MAESNNTEMIGFIASTVETISDRLNGIEERMATKADINRLEVASTAIRGDIEQVQLRLDTMEHRVAPRFETALRSRLISLSTCSVMAEETQDFRPVLPEEIGS